MAEIKEPDDMAIDLVQAEEGYCSAIYKDHLGNLTVGYGVLLKEGVSIPAKALEAMFEYNMSKAVAGYNKFGLTLNGPRRAVIISMLYQMGYRGVRGFQNMLKSLYAGDYEAAAKHMLDSKWAKCDTPERAERQADIMKSGKF